MEYQSSRQGSLFSLVLLLSLLATSVKAVLLIVMKQLPRDVQMKGLSLMVATSSSVSTTVTMLLFSLICSEPPVRVKRLMSGDSDIRLCRVSPVGMND